MPQGIPAKAMGARAGSMNWRTKPMTQNLVTLNLTDAQLTAVDAALTELETQLGGLIALPVPKGTSEQAVIPAKAGIQFYHPPQELDDQLRC